MKHFSLKTPVKTTLSALRSQLHCLTLIFILALAAGAQAATTTLCVDQHGQAGCESTIGAAITAAAPGVTINVHAGTYHEGVIIGKSISLVGDSAATTTIDAIGYSNGIYIDGFDNPGLADVIVTGFTIMHGNYEGILVNEASAVTIFHNIVKENDRSLQPSLPACPGLPAFETMEQTDCGEGIHFISVTHSSIANNFVKQNAGGILISDEVATAHDNLITRNLVLDNSYASGITLASHPAYQTGGSTVVAYGLYNNTVSENDSVHNGFGPPAAGAGVEIIAPGASNRAYANQIVRNRIVANAISGVAIRNLANFSIKGNSNNPDVSRNEVANNFIAGNGADPLAPTAVPTGISIYGVSPITDLLIDNNVIDEEDLAVAFNSASKLELHLNDFLGHKVAVANFNPAGMVNARENWWGCASGPGTAGCSTLTGPAVSYIPWLGKPIDAFGGHGFDHFFDLLHDHDFDHNHDCDLSRFFHHEGDRDDLYHR